jgi:hypothetical protein
METNKIVRYGKSIFDILNVKRGYFEENESFLKEAKRAWGIYKKQPKRTHCKMCGAALPKEKIFSSLEVDFFLCDTCGHVSGGHEETDAYAEEMYSGESLQLFYKEASQNSYNARMESVYIPKALFLQDSLRSLGADYENMSVLDVGAGCGYMIGALKRLGIQAAGIEVSSTETAFGNRMLGEDCITLCGQDDSEVIIRETQAQVASFMGVLEHVQNLDGILKSVSGNERIKYMYFVVPCFSLANIISMVFPDVFNRHLALNHTHLFSNESLDFMYKKYGMTLKAEWRFGTDIMDLYRCIMVRLGGLGEGKKIQSIASDFFKSNADSMQMIVDKYGFASEIHALVEVNHCAARNGDI